tara:strand:- start:2 stop:127 length:126 start_codon:yes stop_codon:yes gene_type:complete
VVEVAEAISLTVEKEALAVAEAEELIQLQAVDLEVLVVDLH